MVDCNRSFMLFERTGDDNSFSFDDMLIRLLLGVILKNGGDSKKEIAMKTYRIGRILALRLLALAG